MYKLAINERVIHLKIKYFLENINVLEHCIYNIILYNVVLYHFGRNYVYTYNIEYTDIRIHVRDPIGSTTTSSINHRQQVLYKHECVIHNILTYHYIKNCPVYLNAEYVNTHRPTIINLTFIVYFTIHKYDIRCIIPIVIFKIHV